MGPFSSSRVSLLFFSAALPNLSRAWKIHNFPLVSYITFGFPIHFASFSLLVLVVLIICCCFVQSLRHVWLFATLWTAAYQFPCPPPSLGVCSNSCPLSRWWHPTISSSVSPLSSCPQFSPHLGLFKIKKKFFLATLDLHGSPQAQLPCSMWDLSSPARNGTHEGGFLTTGPPEKSHLNTFKLGKRHATSGKIRFYRIPLQ